jgi:predicted NUDIX family NTP pyrophosphohydrolase
MPKQAAGLLVYRVRDRAIDVFLVHPGGPFWAKKDAAAWSIPKGEFNADEEPLAAARREFTEETGFTLAGPFAPLGTIRVSSAKVLHAFATEADLDPAQVKSNTFKLEWPPRSGRWAEFPEVDRADWFPLDVAKEKIHRGQLELLTRFETALKEAGR